MNYIPDPCAAWVPHPPIHPSAVCPLEELERLDSRVHGNDGLGMTGRRMKYTPLAPLFIEWNKDGNALLSLLYKRDNADVRARLRAETHMHFGVQARLDEWVSMRVRLAELAGKYKGLG